MAATLDKQSLKDKLLSTKRWGTVLGALMPFVLKAVQESMPWWAVIAGSVMVILAGLGVIAWEDVARIKGATLLAMEQAKGVALIAMDEAKNPSASILDDPTAPAKPPPR